MNLPKIKEKLKVVKSSAIGEEIVSKTENEGVFMDSPKIEEKLKVFISSAMRKENVSGIKDDFKWRDFREKLKNELNSCPYIEAFIIEDHASEMNSNDFMKYNIDKSDIVVLLIINEFRKGTCVEYIHCRETNKPLLAFFFGDENAKKEVIALRANLEQSDYCTYRTMSDFTNAEKNIANDVIQNVIDYYKCKHHISPMSHSIDIDGVPVETTYKNDSYVPTKTVLSQFKTCYKTIYKYIGLSDFIDHENSTEEQSKLHFIGEHVLKWVINGENFFFLEQ